MHSSLKLLCTVSLLTLAACDGTIESSKGPVDPGMLGPLPARELLAVESGNQSLRMGDARSAEVSYRTAAAMSKGHVDAHIMLARLLYKQGRTAEAQHAVQEGLNWQPENPELNLMLGKHLLSQKHYPEAQRVFENGLTRAPRSIDLLTGRGIAQDMQGDHISAQMTYKEAITFNQGEDASFVKNNLGLSYLFSNSPKKAVELLEPLASAPNASAVTKHNLALAYGLLDQDAKAKELLGETYNDDIQKKGIESLKQYYVSRKSGEEPATPPTLPVQDQE